jgi:hypothetical protein
MADAFHQRLHRRSLLRGVGDRSGSTVHHDRAVVGTVVELRTRVHDAVEEGDRHGDRDAVGACLQSQPPARGSVQIQGVVDADMQRGQDPRLTVDHEGDRTVVRLVQNGVGLVALVVHAVAVAGCRAPGGGLVEVGHGTLLAIWLVLVHTISCVSTVSGRRIQRRFDFREHRVGSAYRGLGRR